MLHVSKLWFHLERTMEVNLKNPAMIVAVSTLLPQYEALYSQGRELGKYILRKMKFEVIARIHSSSFSPDVLVREDGISALPACYVYLNRGRRDVLLFGGDTSPIDDQYEFTRLLLSYAKELGVKEIFSVSARWTEIPVAPDIDPQPKGFATDSVGTARLREHGVKLITEEPAPFFASIVVGLARDYGIRGYKLSVDHGELSPHPRSVAQLLGVLSSLIGFEVSLEELHATVGTQAPARHPSDATIYH